MGPFVEELWSRGGRQENERVGGQKEKETKRVRGTQKKVDQKNNSRDRQAGWDERSMRGVDKERNTRKRGGEGERGREGQVRFQ